MSRIDRKTRREGSLKKKFKFGHVDDQVMKRWDSSKTALENFALMGLVYNNKFVLENDKALKKLGMESKPIELAVPEPIKAKERGINFHLQHYIRPLIIKYKDDYEKMKMDHKLNFYQKTATELEKLAKKFIVLYGHPIHGDIYQKEQERKRIEQEEEEIKRKQEQEQKEKELLNKKQQQSKTTTKKSTASTNNNNNTTTTTTTKKVTKTPSTTVSKPKTTTTTTTTKTITKKVVKSK